MLDIFRTSPDLDTVAFNVLTSSIHSIIWFFFSPGAAELTAAGRIHVNESTLHLNSLKGYFSDKRTLAKTESIFVNDSLRFLQKKKKRTDSHMSC